MSTENGDRAVVGTVCARGPTNAPSTAPLAHMCTHSSLCTLPMCVHPGSAGRCLKIAARARVPFRAQLRPSLTRPYRAHPRQPVSRLVEAWVAPTGVLCGCPPAPPPAKRSRRPRGRPRRHVDGCRACWRSLAADRDLPPPHDRPPLATRCHHDPPIRAPVVGGRGRGLDSRRRKGWRSLRPVSRGHTSPAVGAASATASPRQRSRPALTQNGGWLRCHVCVTCVQCGQLNFERRWPGCACASVCSFLQLYGFLPRRARKLASF